MNETTTVKLRDLSDGTQLYKRHTPASGPEHGALTTFYTWKDGYRYNEIDVYGPEFKYGGDVCVPAHISFASTSSRGMGVEEASVFAYVLSLALATATELDATGPNTD